MSCWAMFWVALIVGIVFGAAIAAGYLMMVLEK